jgi:hypothetical protein
MEGSPPEAKWTVPADTRSFGASRDDLRLALILLTDEYSSQ